MNSWGDVNNPYPIIDPGKSEIVLESVNPEFAAFFSLEKLGH